MKNRDLKKLLNAYLKARTAADLADDAWDEDLENEKLEAEFDRCYKAEHEAFEALAASLSRFSHGKITLPVARMLLRKKFDETADLIRRLAA